MPVALVPATGQPGQSENPAQNMVRSVNRVWRDTVARLLHGGLRSLYPVVVSGECRSTSPQLL